MGKCEQKGTQAINTSHSLKGEACGYKQLALNTMISQDGVEVKRKDSQTGAWQQTTDELTRKAMNMSYEDWTRGGDYQALAGQLLALARQAYPLQQWDAAQRAQLVQQQFGQYFPQLEAIAQDMYPGLQSDAPQDPQLALPPGEQHEAGTLGGDLPIQNAAKGETTQLKNAAGRPIIVVEHISLIAEPGSITQRIDKKGGIHRNFYGEDGVQKTQISNNGHGHKKEEALGKHGEHAHDYYIDENGKLKRGEARELTDEERRDNDDFL